MSVNAELRDAILADLKANGPSTSRAIAERLNLKPRAVSASLEYMRGERVVHDGSVTTPVLTFNGDIAGYLWDRPKGPITWSLPERVYLTSGVPGSEHDPEPWAYSRTSKSGEGLFGTPDRSAERWDRAMHWFPRPEFDHHNPILVDLREYWAHHGTRLSAEHARGYLEVTNLEAFDATPEEVAHARRILTRLTNLTNEPLEG